MSESTELVVVPSKETALEAFKADNGLDPYLQTIRQELDAFLQDPPSLDTKKGRDAYASMAFKIARSKTAIDNIGKELVADLKQLPKTIDAERKRWRDQLDAWRDEARGPLNDWEAAEESRKSAHENRIDWLRNRDDLLDELNSTQIAERISEAECVEIGEHWEEYEAEAARTKGSVLTKLRAALVKREKYEAEQAELERLRQEAAEREQKEREERIAREAKDSARREAEQAAQAEREAAKEAAERREREHEEAVAKAKRDAEFERQRIQDEHDRKERERIAEEHRREQARLDAERKQREEEERRQADKKHRGNVNRKALKAMVDNGMTEECAKQAITMIAQGKVPGVTVNY